MVVLFAWMPNHCRRHSLIVFNFKKRDVSRVSEGDQQFSPAGVLLQERFSAGERREGEKVQRSFNGHECTLSRAQVTFEQEIVEAVEVLVCLTCEADLISHLRTRCAFASRLRSPAIALSAGTESPFAPGASTLSASARSSSETRSGGMVRDLILDMNNSVHRNCDTYYRAAEFCASFANAVLRRGIGATGNTVPAAEATAV